MTELNNTCPVQTGAAPALPQSQGTEQTSPIIDKAEMRRRVPVCPRTIDDWLKRGLIPHIKLPGTRRVLFHWPSVEAALKRHQRGGPTP